MSKKVNVIDKMFEYNLWANTTLIKLCSGLTDEQLQVEVVGVFGQIQPTLVHLVRAEGGYLNRLTGAPLWADDLDWEAMSMDDLLQNAQLSGNKLIDVASEIDPEVIHTVDFPNFKGQFFNWTVVLQALYHGIEHRTQIKSLLTKLGVEHPELAAWDYTVSLFQE